MITSTSENDHVVDKDDSVVSDDMSNTAEECDLRAEAMPDVSLSGGLRYSRRTLHRKGARTAQRHIGMCV